MWTLKLCLPSMEIKILWNKARLNLLWMLYAVLVHLFNKEINHIWLLLSSGKLLWHLIWCSFRIPPLQCQIELMFEIFYRRVKKGQDATCNERLPANRNQKFMPGIKLLCQACGKHMCPKHLLQKCEHCAWHFCYILSYYDIVYI